MTSWTRVAAGCTAIATAAIAFSPRIDALADASFAWHMAQHLAIMLILPLALLLACPPDYISSLFGKKRLTIARAARTTPVRILTSAPLALYTFTFVLWATHYSRLYEVSLEHPPVHAFEHVLYFIAGTIFWLPVIAPRPLHPIAHPLRVLYLFAGLPQGAFLAIALSAATHALYPHYVALQGVANALDDQRNAAAIIWLGGGAIVFTALLGTLASWAHRERATPKAPARMRRRPAPAVAAIPAGRVSALAAADLRSKRSFRQRSCVRVRREAMVQALLSARAARDSWRN